MVKNQPANAGDTRDVDLIPEWERSPGEKDGNSLQYSCLENPMDRGAPRDTVHSITKNRTLLKRLNTHHETNIKSTLRKKILLIFLKPRTVSDKYYRFQ